MGRRTKRSLRFYRTMNFEVLYSYLIDVTWLFLGGWVALLAAAYLVVFGRERG